MPKYFFDIFDKSFNIDEEGSDAPDIESARKLACASIGEILRDASRTGNPARCVVTVRDNGGTKLFTVTASLTIEPA